MGTGLEVFALATMAAGTVMTTVSQLSAARDAKNIANMNAENTRKVAEYNAAIDRQAAGQEDAAAQLRAAEAKRQARLKQSRVLALVGASGGGAMDMDVLNIIAGFEEEGDLAARTELYEGGERSRKLRARASSGIWQGETGANIIEYDGRTEAAALKRKAVGTILGGASSLAGKYGAYTDGKAA